MAVEAKALATLELTKGVDKFEGRRLIGWPCRFVAGP